MKYRNYLFLFLFCTHCASASSVFPSVELSTVEEELELPNPISIAVDEANAQILVANSNVDIFYLTGSLSVINVDGSDPDSPVLSAVSVIEAPNFAGKMFADGTGNIFIPFRESSASDTDLDQIHSYSLTDDAVSLLSSATVSDDPFGITGDGVDSIYVVSDDVLSIFDMDLQLQTEIDLTVPDSEGLANTDSSAAEQVALDAVNNRAIVSNLNGEIFVVDLATNEVDQVIEGPLSTRDLIVDGSILYALDGDLRSVWIFDLDQLSNASELTAVDDSQFVLGRVSVGTDPNGMVLDSANNRLYVANSFDDSISVIDLITRTEIVRISIDAEDISTVFNRDGEDPQALALGTFDGNQFLFVASYGTNSVVVISTDSLKVVQVFPNTEFELDDDED